MIELNFQDERLYSAKLYSFGIGVSSLGIGTFLREISGKNVTFSIEKQEGK